MSRLVRIILTATVGGFLSGIRQAQTLFMGFVRGIQTGTVLISQVLQGIQAAVGLVTGAFRTLISVAGMLESAFLRPAMNAETFRVTLEQLTGSSDVAGQMFERLRNMSTELGLDFEGLQTSAIQVTAALRAQGEATNIEKWQDMLNLVAQFSSLRPDVPIQLWGRAITAFIAGDAMTLTRLLDLNVTQLAGLSEEARRFIEGGEAGMEQQLGRVTRLGEGAAAAGGDGLAALQEIAQLVGATSELMEARAETMEGKLARLEARWLEFRTRIGDIGAEIVDDALGEILDWIDEHEEDINRFLDNLEDFALDKWEDLKRIIEETDWEQVGRDIKDTFDDAKVVLEDVVELLDKIKEFFTGEWANVFPESEFAQWMDDTFGPGGPLSGGPGATNERLFAPSEADLERGARTREALWGTDRGGTLAQQAANAAGRDENPLADAMREWFGNLNINVDVTIDEEGRLQVRRIARQEANQEVGSLVNGITGGRR